VHRKYIYTYSREAEVENLYCIEIQSMFGEMDGGSVSARAKEKERKKLGC